MWINMKKIFFYFTAFVLVFGCASSDYFYYERSPVHKIVGEPLPEWVYKLPEGNFVIGISRKTADKEEMIDAAKQMAAVIMSRNKASFTVDKSAYRNSEDIMKSGKAQLKINVSFSPKETEKIYSELKMADQTFYFNYFIALFSTSEITLNDDYKKKNYLPEPSWLAENKITKENHKLKTYVSATSSDLIIAWEKAAEKARLQIADYLEKNVEGLVKSKNEEIEKLITLETNKIIGNLRISRSYIRTEMKDSLIGYTVYLEMEMKRK